MTECGEGVCTPNELPFDTEDAEHAGPIASDDVLDYGWPRFVLHDIPGPDGVPLMNTPWQLYSGEAEIESGVTDARGRVLMSVTLQPASTYRLDYPGRSVTLKGKELADVGTNDGMQQRLMYLGYDPGPGDGVMGPRTRSALIQFQVDHELLTNDDHDAQITNKLLDAHGR